MSTLLSLTPDGLYCEAGDFHIDPWRPVRRALITHAHGDHARWGSRRYFAAAEGVGVLRARLGPDARVHGVAWGEVLERNGVRVSLHPAGHILGSAQVRVEHRGEVWVVTGDYKTERDPTCAPFEPLRCHTLVTESTFGLPIYRWRPQAEVFAEMDEWWRANVAAGRSSVLFAYALGKAQRLLAGVDASIGPILLHGAMARFTRAYREAGVTLPDARWADDASIKATKGHALVLAPPSAQGSPWMRRFDPSSTAFASGWMQIRGARRRQALDRGFAISDHADWDGLLATVRDTGAERVWVTHGYSAVLARWLREEGLDAAAVPTRWEGETADEGDGSPAAEGETGGVGEWGNPGLEAARAESVRVGDAGVDFARDASDADVAPSPTLPLSASAAASALDLWTHDGGDDA
ncbi:MAG TPA: ligase-associated DNA damage response exonuclease [Longimicrobiales bacterium]